MLCNELLFHSAISVIAVPLNYRTTWSWWVLSSLHIYSHVYLTSYWKLVSGFHSLSDHFSLLQCFSHKWSFFFSNSRIHFVTLRFVDSAELYVCVIPVSAGSTSQCLLVYVYFSGRIRISNRRKSSDSIRNEYWYGFVWNYIMFWSQISLKTCAASWTSLA